MSNRGRHKKKDNLKELLKRISNKAIYQPIGLFYKHTILVTKQRIYLTGIDKETITTWLNIQKQNGFDKIIIDNLTFII